MLMVIIAVVVSGLIIGALARLAVPGPDPMPWWQTILLGLAGSLLGGLVSAAVGFTDTSSGDAAGSFLVSVVAATVLLVVYRKYVQRRPITGPGSH